MHSIRESIRNLLLGSGFDAARFTAPVLPDGTKERLRVFLEEGRHGDMAWMRTHEERRADPKMLWSEVRSIIVVGHNYAPPINPLTQLGERHQGLISAYARGADYHEVMKKKLRAICGVLSARHACDVKLFVDTAPVMEKPLAAQAGMGWQGKHSCLVSRDFGSWLFLGEIFTTLDLPPDASEPDHCGTCRKCLDICPTDAFVAPYQLDARRCISYLTIEHPSHIPTEFRAKIGNRIYGCDDCLAVCPWNKFAQTARESAYLARDAMDLPALSELLTLDDAAFRQYFRGSPVKRIKRARFIRNVLIAAGNSGERIYLPLIEKLLKDDSPLVRAAAIWAVLRLATREEFGFYKERYGAQETDGEVTQEWHS